MSKEARRRSSTWSSIYDHFHRSLPQPQDLGYCSACGKKGPKKYAAPQRSPELRACPTLVSRKEHYRNPRRHAAGGVEAALVRRLASSPAQLRPARAGRVSGPVVLLAALLSIAAGSPSKLTTSTPGRRRGLVSRISSALVEWAVPGCTDNGVGGNSDRGQVDRYRAAQARVLLFASSCPPRRGRNRPHARLGRLTTDSVLAATAPSGGVGLATDRA